MIFIGMFYDHNKAKKGKDKFLQNDKYMGSYVVNTGEN